MTKFLELISFIWILCVQWRFNTVSASATKSSLQNEGGSAAQQKIISSIEPYAYPGKLKLFLDNSIYLISEPNLRFMRLEEIKIFKGLLFSFGYLKRHDASIEKWKKIIRLDPCCSICDKPFKENDLVAKTQFESKMDTKTIAIKSLVHINCVKPLSNNCSMDYLRIVDFEKDAFGPQFLIDVRAECFKLCEAAKYLLHLLEIHPDFQSKIKVVLENLLLAYEFSESPKCDSSCKDCVVFRMRFESFDIEISQETLAKILFNLPPRRLRISLLLVEINSNYDYFWLLRRNFEEFTREDAFTLMSFIPAQQNFYSLPKENFEEVLPLYEKFMIWLYTRIENQDFEHDRDIFHTRMSAQLLSNREHLNMSNDYSDQDKRLDDFILNKLIYGVLKDEKSQQTYAKFINFVKSN